MKKSDYYSSGEFARMAGVTLRTIRYYDKQNILKPSFVTEAGARFYTDEDFARLQQILLLKYLGFSLEDIKEMTIADLDGRFMLDSLEIQLKLVQDRIEQMQLVEQAIRDTADAIRTEQIVDWSKMLNLIHLTGMEKSLKNQYQNATNISSRINLHSLYSQNKQGWFRWIYEQCGIKAGMNILEIGCGDGTLWKQNAENIPPELRVMLSDVSEGMLRDARRVVGTAKGTFTYQVADGQDIPCANESFDLVIANHVLFYCDEIDEVCAEVTRVLKPGGYFICSTYGSGHMGEISRLMREFDERIVLSADRLYEKFGKENGGQMLLRFFGQVKWRQYEDWLMITEPEPLIAYVLSCHGNQGQYLLERYSEFRTFVRKRIDKGLRISKDAGIFVCRK